MKKVFLFIIFLSFLAAGFFLFQKEIPKILENNKEQFLEQKENSPLPEISLSSFSPSQGDILVIKVKNLIGEGKVEGELLSDKESRKINFFQAGSSKNDWLALVGISTKEKPQKQKLILRLPQGKIIEREIEIKERKFLVEEFLVSEELKKEGYDQAKITEDLIKKEKPILDEVFAIFTPEIYFESPFLSPLKEIEVVGDFGAIRKEGNSELQHLGVDLKADFGTPVFAINDGVVRFAENTKLYGKTVIIDHGFSIFSFYCHLNKTEVSNGQEIKKGDIVGLAGQSGYALGPHLHFTVKINGISIDPLKFLETMNKEL